MLPRWITAFYLAYLAIPIALLVVGSFGELWLNTLLPTGFTLRVVSRCRRRPELSPRLRSQSRGRRRSTCGVVPRCSGCRSPMRSTARAARRARRSRACSINCPSRCRRWCSRSASSWCSRRTRCRGSAASGCSRPATSCSACPISCRPSSPTCGASACARWRTRRSRWAARAGSVSSTSSCRRCAIRSSPGSSWSRRLSIGEFQFSNLVAGFLNRTYPVVLLQAFYGATGFACAATVVLLAARVGRRGRGRRSRRDGASRMKRPCA